MSNKYKILVPGVKPYKQTILRSDNSMRIEDALKIEDSFQNVLQQTGTGTLNMMEGTQYQLTRLTQNYQMLIAMYRNNWLVRRIIDTFPKAMLKNGWKYQSDIDPKKLDKISKAYRDCKLRRSLLRGLKWGRLFGGALGLMLISGQEDELDQPLDIDAIMPGDFHGLVIADRWSGAFPSVNELVTDSSDPDYGKPEYYDFQGSWGISADKIRVHHSRVVRFEGDDLPTWEELSEQYWGASKIESVFEELKKRDNTSANIALLIFQARLKVFQMDGLEQILGNADAQAKTFRIMQAQTKLMNNFSSYVMGKDDKMQSFDYSFTGISEVYESFMMDVSGSTEIPMTKLFGRSPAGMNATGESDLQNFYDVVVDNQEEHLRPIVEKLTPVICASSLGEIPDDIEAVFNPPKSLNDNELGESMKWKSELLFGAYDRAGISQQTFGRELQQLAPDTGMFTNLTDEDVEKMSDKIEDPADMLTGMNEAMTGENSNPSNNAKPKPKNAK